MLRKRKKNTLGFTYQTTNGNSASIASSIDFAASGGLRIYQLLHNFFRYFGFRTHGTNMADALAAIAVDKQKSFKHSASIDRTLNFLYCFRDSTKNWSIQVFRASFLRVLYEDSF